MKKAIILLTFFSFFPLAEAEIRSVHCPLGCPSLEIQNNVVVFNHLYAISQNKETKAADWVAYEVNVLNFGDGPGRNWSNNPLLHDNERLEEDDYSDANKILQVDRGHQAPLASFAGSRYWSELNYLSNITPQKSDLNQGSWQKLEQAVRDAVEFRRSLYVITGVLHDGAAMKLPKVSLGESHKIPTHYYKIIYDNKGDSTTFIFSQNSARDMDKCSARVSLSFLKSKLNYTLPTLKDSPEIAKKLRCK